MLVVKQAKFIVGDFHSPVIIRVHKNCVLMISRNVCILVFKRISFMLFVDMDLEEFAGTKFHDIDCVISAATTLLPSDFSHQALEMNVPFRYKLKALKRVCDLSVSEICCDLTRVYSVMQFINAHLFHYSSYYELTLESTFQKLEEHGTISSSYVEEPAWESIIQPIHGLLLRLTRSINDPFAPEFLVYELTPGYFRSLIPLLMTPFVPERNGILDILVYIVFNTSGEYTVAILNALEDYICYLNQHNMPLRAVNDILLLLETIWEDCITDNPVLNAFMCCLQTAIVPLHHHRHFYIISDGYIDLISKVISKHFKHERADFCTIFSEELR